MPLTAEEVAERLAHLRAGREQLRADLLTTDGAIQDCEYWLARIGQEAATSLPPEPTEPDEETAWSA